MSNIPHEAIVFSEVGAKLLDMGERDKAYELLVIAGNFALSGEVITEPIREEE